MSAPLELLLTRWPEGRQVAANAWRGPCPVCGGSRRSSKLSVTENAAGALLLHCFGGCPADAVCAAFGIDVGDLFPPRDRALQREREGRRRDLLDARTGLRLIEAEVDEATRLILVCSREDLTPERRQRLAEAARSIRKTAVACGVRLFT